MPNEQYHEKHCFLDQLCAILVYSLQPTRPVSVAAVATLAPERYRAGLYMATKVIMSPPSGSGDILFFSARPSVCLDTAI